MHCKRRMTMDHRQKAGDKSKEMKTLQGHGSDCAERFHIYICMTKVPSWIRKNLCLLLVLHILSSMFNVASAYPHFTEPNPGYLLQKIALDAQTDSVFVSSTNRVYKLSSNLTVEVEAVTGPVLDDPSCVPPRQCPLGTLTDNYNKVLVVNDEQLIVCGTVYQGVCDVLSVSTLKVLSNSSLTEISVNTEYGTTVAFVSNGPNNMKTLYVGSSTAQWYRGNLWTMSSRQLPSDLSSSSLFKVYNGEGPRATNPTQIAIPPGTIDDSPAMQKFNISYISGFAAGNFSYFVAIQPVIYNSPSHFFTKISRICQRDDHFYSYTELPLQCYAFSRDGRTLYNLAQSAYLGTVGSNLGSSTLQPGTDVLYVVFARSNGMTDMPTTDSAVCMYPISFINTEFWKRRIGCAMLVTDRTDIDWFGSAPCGTSESMQSLINSSGPGYCHMNNNNHPLGGQDYPIMARAVYTHPSVLTSIAATVHRDETVIFLGDQDGQLKKLRLQDETTAQLYEELVIDTEGGMVQNGLQLSPDENHVYVMTDTKITKVPVEECETYTSYEECVGVGGGIGDPYCGWCTLYQRCTRGVESECPGAGDASSHRWLSGGALNTQIEQVFPPHIRSDTVVQLEIEVLNLPTLDLSQAYQCVFGDLGVRPAAVSPLPPNRYLVSCYTPANIPDPVNGYIRVELSLQPTEIGTSVASTEFYFYKCGTFSTCIECVMQQFGCAWCGYNSTCAGESSLCEIQEGIVLGIGTSTNSPFDAIGPDSCPHIGLSNDTELLIAAGIATDIRLSVANLPVPLESATGGYECVFQYENRELAIPASLDGDSALVCHDNEYGYETVANSIPGSLKVRWNGVYIAESSMPVTLYKCAVERPNCGLCLGADAKFQCGWCSSQFECGLESQCSSSSRWLMGAQAVCPDPTIRELTPRSGHLTGGTNLTIHGYNLGLMAADIISISVAGIPCVIEQESYVPALKISCTTQKAERPKDGSVEVVIGDVMGQTYTAISNNTFSYVLPKIVGVDPPFGPVSGGSRVSIFGHNLDAGSSSFASLAGIRCQILSAMPTEVICISNPSTAVMLGPVSMMVDNHYVEGVSTFEYRPDPVINKLNRFSSISSGSLKITIEGSNFDTIQWPQLNFNVGTHQLLSNCTNTPNRLTCLTPNVTDLVPKLPFSLPIANVSFVLDSVAEYAPLQNNGGISGVSDFFGFHPDPVYYKFAEDRHIKQFKFEGLKPLTIRGDNLTLAFVGGDVTVTIGGVECTDAVVKPQDVNCDAPEKAPSNDAGRRTFEVKVYQGSLEFSVGSVEYLPRAIPLPLIVGSVAGGILLLLCLLIVAVCIASYQKNNNNEKIFKQMEEQRDALELTVAQECKEAFAELQTGVLSITHDIKGFGIPILDYRTYVVKSLFPENPNHAVLRELTVAGVRKDFVHKGLWQFGQLLSNKSFLMIFVRVLEEQRTLSTKDLSNVASLLVVAFQGKMEYCTDILKALMARAIRHHVKEGEESTKVFMRRGVWVVEKMVGHWLSVLLYDHLQDRAGEPLFKLFYAIKQQVEKGPVDAVTGEARYSLTEGKLIRQQVEVKQLTLKAQGPDRNTAMVEVKVLDCDTISQTKDKILDVIYKSSPYSQRPHKDELDLEWYDRPDGKLLLFDDDGLRQPEGGWRRLNTLAHYQVPDGSTVFLLQAQGGSGSLHSNHSSPVRSYVNINLNIHQTPTSSMSPMITTDNENSNRVWHLVKPADHQPLQNGVNDRKMMAEIYLPRLLTTKTILQKFVDDLMTTVFMLDHDGSSPPLPIKYLFDFLDDQARVNNISDPTVIHAWKSNCVPLRFWVNLIKNPDMIFDIHKADTVDSCLSVVAQCVMEACSVSEQQLNKNSPASKLLYAKDIPTYKEYVSQYYNDIQDEPVLSDQEMSTMLAEHSQRHHYDFYTLSALNELYFGYACKYRSELITALDADDTAIKQGHAEKIEEIERIMSKSF